MCVSLLERVKQGKSNIILILILSARSQDRDRATTLPHLASIMISIHSVARPRRQDAINSSFVSLISIHSVARPRLGAGYEFGIYTGVSIHSVARPRQFNQVRFPESYHFNPLGRKTETVLYIA